MQGLLIACSVRGGSGKLKGFVLFLCFFVADKDRGSNERPLCKESDCIFQDSCHCFLSLALPCDRWGFSSLAVGLNLNPLP